MAQNLSDLTNDAIAAVMTFGILGGIFNFAKAVVHYPNRSVWLAVASFVSNVSVSTGVGFATFVLAMAWRDNQLEAIGYAGFAAYLGLNLLYIVEGFLYSKLGIKKAGNEKETSNASKRD